MIGELVTDNHLEETYLAAKALVDKVKEDRNGDWSHPAAYNVMWEEIGIDYTKETLRTFLIGIRLNFNSALIINQIMGSLDLLCDSASRVVTSWVGSNAEYYAIAYEVYKEMES